MLRFVFLVAITCQALADIIPGYDSIGAKANILRSDNLGNSIFVWAQDFDNGSSEIRYVTSFSTGRFSNYSVFGKVEAPNAYNATYDNTLNCLLFYSVGNQLFYSYGDPRKSTFSQNKQAYTIEGCNLIYTSQMRYCSAANAFYITLVADTGLFFLKFNGSFAAISLVAGEGIDDSSFNFDTEGNVLATYSKYISQNETSGTEYYCIYISKEMVKGWPSKIFSSEDVQYPGVFQINNSGSNYWTIISSNAAIFLNNTATSISDVYDIQTNGEIQSCRQFGELIIFANQFPDEVTIPSVSLEFYDVSNIPVSNTDPIAPQKITVIDNIQITPKVLYSQISQKGSDIFLSAFSEN